MQVLAEYNEKKRQAMNLPDLAKIDELPSAMPSIANTDEWENTPLIRRPSRSFRRNRLLSIEQAISIYEK